MREAHEKVKPRDHAVHWSIEKIAHMCLQGGESSNEMSDKDGEVGRGQIQEGLLIARKICGFIPRAMKIC